MASSPWQFSAVAVDVTMTLVVWDILRATLCVAPIVIPCYCFLDGIDHIGGGTTLCETTVLGLRSGPARMNIQRDWNVTGGTQQIVMINYHGFGLGQNLPSGFGDGNRRNSMEFHMFSTKKNRHTVWYSLIWIHDMFIEEQNLRLMLGGIVVIISTVGSGVCLVMLDFDSQAGKIRDDGKGHPSKSKSIASPNCAVGSHKNASFLWFQNHPAKTTVSVFFETGFSQ